MEFRQSVFYPCHLGWTFRHSNKCLIVSVFSHVVTHDHGPGEVLEGFYQTLNSFFLNVKTLDKVFSGHTGDLVPHHLVEMFRSFSAILFFNKQKPEAVHHAIVPQEKA